MRFAWIAALLAMLAAGWLAAGDGTPADPLRDEDIVRMFVSGRNADDLAALIGRSDVDFEVDDDMIDELDPAVAEPLGIAAAGGAVGTWAANAGRGLSCGGGSARYRP